MKWEIEVREKPNPSLARIVIAGQWNAEPQKAKKLLVDICRNWPKNKKVKFLITCGGFIQFDWPESISRECIGDNKNPSEDSVCRLVQAAKECAKSVLDDGLDKELREFTDYITLGIDSSKKKISKTQNYIRQLHVELVLLADLRNSKLHWTGKSYPTTNQEKGLVRISDLQTHLFNLNDIGNTLVLGCHDLNVFNPRGRATTKTCWRKKIREDFYSLVKKEKPQVVLHHPHTTDSSKIWTAAWNELRKVVSMINIYGGAGRYDNEGQEPRSQLEDVLEKTKCGNTIDFIIRTNKEL
jgi:hypothetical protein